MNFFTMILVCILFGAFAIGAFYLVVDEKKRRREIENENKKNTAVVKKYTEEKKENEKLMDKAMCGNNADSFNASVELMHQLSEKGQKRNSK